MAVKFRRRIGFAIEEIADLCWRYVIKFAKQVGLLECEFGVRLVARKGRIPNNINLEF
jgi:hypothetical protein